MLIGGLDIRLKEMTEEKENVIAELAFIDRQKHCAEVEVDKLRMELSTFM